MYLDKEIIRQMQQAVDNESEDEPTDLAEELHWAILRGNTRKPIRPPKANNTKLNIVRAQRQWERFVKTIGIGDWKSVVRSLSYQNRGIIESFIRYLLRRRGSRLQKETSVRVYMRHTWQVFKKYTALDVDPQLKEHTLDFIRAEITKLFALSREPKRKDQLGPDGHLFLSHFRWARDTTTFHIGLDRIDDVCIRHLLMFAGARQHEFVYALPRNHAKQIQQYHDDEDAYADIDIAKDPFMQPREKKCSICGEKDERTESMGKVLCWEDIELWIVRDPRGKGRDELAMQVLLRFHKGEEIEMRPTWYTFVEEPLPVLCPITFIIIKALAEGVIEHPDYQSAEKLFGTKIGTDRLLIRWKREFMHVPVFRKTVAVPGGGFGKSAEPTTDDIFNHNSNKLGLEAGLPGRLSSYVYRRGNLQVMDKHYRETIRNQAARHSNSRIYTKHYQNPRLGAVFQDAFLGRGTESPHIAIFNYMMRFDENAPKKLSPEALSAIAPNQTVRRLDEVLTSLRRKLRSEHKAVRRAPTADRQRYERIKSERRAAQQKQYRRAFEIFRDAYFARVNDEELSKQAQGIQRPPAAIRTVEFRQPERRHLAEIFSDLDEDVPEERVVQRKIEAVNAAVDYAWKLDLGVVPLAQPLLESSPKPKPGPSPEASPKPLPGLSPEPTVPSPRIVLRPKPLPGPSPEPTVPSPRIVLRPKPPAEPSSPSPSPPPSPPPRAPSSANSRRTRRTRRTPPPPPCIFCGQPFSRTSSMWTHVDRHLQHIDPSHVPCPDRRCEEKRVWLESVQSFKAHAFHVHKIALRPQLIILRH